jgi:hypothetical protein
MEHHLSWMLSDCGFDSDRNISVCGANAGAYSNNLCYPDRSETDPKQKLVMLHDHVLRDACCRSHCRFPLGCGSRCALFMVLVVFDYDPCRPATQHHMVPRGSTVKSLVWDMPPISQ